MAGLWSVKKHDKFPQDEPSSHHTTGFGSHTVRDSHASEQFPPFDGVSPINRPTAARLIGSAPSPHIYGRPDYLIKAMDARIARKQ
jgi:hypothetical protein